MGKGSRNARGDKEYTQVQKVIKENKKLKRQIAKLRGQIARIPIELYSGISELVEQHEMEGLEERKLKKNEKLKEIWECHNCREDFLRIFIVPRRDGMFYFRRCPSCDHRTTKLKKFSDDVEGILDEGAIE